MKVYIITDQKEYKIYKVADLLIDDFQIRYGSKIIVEAKDIQEAIQKFDIVEKDPECEFNSQLIKYQGPEKHKIVKKVSNKF